MPFATRNVRGYGSRHSPGRRMSCCFCGRMTPHSAQQIISTGGNMTVSQELANLADMVRAHPKSRARAIAFEFEGRSTSFVELDANTNRVANGLKTLGLKPRERIAYLGKN